MTSGIEFEVSNVTLGSERMTRTSSIVMAAGLFATVIAASSTADASPRYRYGGADHGGAGSGGFVVAHSKFGNGSVTGPVRATRLGRQVQLPGGTWEYCRRSCSETLRVSTVDFWENGTGGGAGATTNECGIFGCLEIRYPR
jgi:hypothetical protein